MRTSGGIRKAATLYCTWAKIAANPSTRYRTKHKAQRALEDHLAEMVSSGFRATYAHGVLSMRCGNNLTLQFGSLSEEFGRRINGGAQ